jgi:hypothetical protein
MPHPGQRWVRQNARRFNWLAAGRRWRKTTLVMGIAVESALRGRQIIWGAPVYDQVRVGWDETRQALAGVAAFNQSEMVVRLPGGGRIIFRSLDDPDNARGWTADGVVTDETGDVNPLAYYEVLRPMLIDTGGWFWGIGTPKGRNWFYKEHAAAKQKTDSRAFQAPTLGCAVVDGQLVRQPHPLENPNIPFDELVNLWQTMPAQSFRQEILAEFLESEGAVFHNIAACLNAPLGARPEHHAGHRIVVGIDWGKQVDYYVASFFCADCACEVELDRQNGLAYLTLVDRLVERCAYWNVGGLLPERNSAGEPVIEHLVARGLPVQSGHDDKPGFMTLPTTKAPLIESLVLAFEREEAQWLAHDQATVELEAYERTTTATGRPQYSAPPGEHDDTVIGRALAWLAAQSSNAYGETVDAYQPTISSSPY